MENSWLVWFVYDYYPGRDAETLLLVDAPSFDVACDRILAMKDAFPGARRFRNLTVR